MGWPRPNIGTASTLFESKSGHRISLPLHPDQSRQDLPVAAISVFVNIRKR